MDRKYKVVLADDHQLLTSGLRMTIEGWEEFEVVGIGSDGLETVALCDELVPDIVLMDMQMPGLSGAEATRKIKASHPEIRVVALTTFYDSETVSQALREGCDGFLLKVINPEQLRSAMHSILQGISVIDSTAMEQLRRQEEARAVGNFSERERLILQYICKGCSNKEIAEKISLQTGTVKNMVSLLLSKTSCVSRADLTRFAIEQHLVER